VIGMVSRIIFDLDDTLLKTGEVFRQQLQQFAEEACSEFSFAESTSRVLELQAWRDRTLRTNTFSNEHFPNSLAATWEYFCELDGRKPNQQKLEQIRELGWQTYDIIPEPLDGMDTVLDELHSDYDLVLYTMGDPDIQRPKINHYDLGQWFSIIHISPHKTTETLEPVYRPFHPDDVALVGDSLRTEIQPGLEHGLSVIHRSPEEMWDFNHVSLDAEFPSIKNLHEIKNHLP
jgi:putative hydrolase of the HAD superfamily